jgi:membrane fusion protein (multidrug efflux system)
MSATIRGFLLKSLLTLVLIAMVLGSLAGIKALQIRSMIAAGESMSMPPESVTTALVATQEWRPYVSSVGTVTAVQGVTVSTEVPGKVVGIHFESGTSVEAGALLVELDASSEQAQLAAAVASAELASINLERSRELFGKQAVAKSELDTAQARSREAVAQVASLEALLAKKQIRAPFSGRLGIREVNLGQFVASGQSVVSLQSVDPVYVDFHVPQQKLERVKVGYPLEIRLERDHATVLKGEVSAVAAEVDRSTRNAWAQGTLPNPDGGLRPGMFVSVEVLEPQDREVVVIPVTSVVYAPYGNSVYVVDGEGDQQVANQRIVRLGESRGDFVEVVEGLKAGETVVTTGAFKLRNGVKVRPANDRGIEFSLEPKPSEA